MKKRRSIDNITCSVRLDRTQLYVIELDGRWNTTVCDRTRW